jgi:hypothetical protein
MALPGATGDKFMIGHPETPLKRLAFGVWRLAIGDWQVLDTGVQSDTIQALDRQRHLIEQTE